MIAAQFDLSKPLIKPAPDVLSEDEYLEWIGRSRARPKPAPINTGSGEAIDPRRAKTIDSSADRKRKAFYSK